MRFTPGKAKHRPLSIKLQVPHSHSVKNGIDNNHLLVVNGDFTVLDRGHRNNTCKTKIAETLMIKVIRPLLNAEKTISGIKTF